MKWENALDDVVKWLYEMMDLIANGFTEIVLIRVSGALVCRDVMEIVFEL